MFEETLARILSRITEFSIATGDATSGSTTTLEDTSAVWEVNKWKDAVVEITQSFQVLTLAPAPAGYVNCVPADIGKMVQYDGVDAGLLLNYNNALRVWQIRTTTTIVSGSVMTIPTGTGAGIAAISVTSTIHYYVTITSNTADTLTFGAIAVAVVAGDHYEIRMPLRKVTVEDLAVILSKVPDIHSSYHWTKFLEDGVDAHFLCSLWIAGDRHTEIGKASDYWISSPDTSPLKDGSLICPIDINEVEITSRKAFAYPFVNFQTKLADITVNDNLIDFGFEQMSAQGTGTAQFMLTRVAGVAKLNAYIAGEGRTAYTDITWALPADYKTAKNNYSVKANKSWFEFRINRELVAIGVAHPESIDISGPPYNIWSCGEGYISPFLPCQIEVMGDRQEELNFPLNPMLVTFSDGDPLPARRYELYNTGTVTKWPGQSIAAGTITSHPVPVYGYSIKTLAFQANGAGSLVIQIYVGGAWRTLKTVAIVANTLDIQAFDMETLIVRCQFTPDAYPTTVNVAEFHLS